MSNTDDGSEPRSSNTINSHSVSNNVETDFFIDSWDDISNDIISRSYFRANNRNNLIDESVNNHYYVTRSSENNNSITNNNNNNYAYNAGNPNVMNNNNNNANNVIAMNNENNRNNNVPLVGVRDRLFHALFFKASLTYARSVPSSVRRVIEFLVLLKVSILILIGTACQLTDLFS